MHWIIAERDERRVVLHVLHVWGRVRRQNGGSGHVGRWRGRGPAPGRRQRGDRSFRRRTIADAVHDAVVAVNPALAALSWSRDVAGGGEDVTFGAGLGDIVAGTGDDEPRSRRRLSHGGGVYRSPRPRRRHPFPPTCRRYLLGRVEPAQATPATMTVAGSGTDVPASSGDRTGPVEIAVVVVVGLSGSARRVTTRRKRVLGRFYTFSRARGLTWRLLREDVGNCVSRTLPRKKTYTARAVR